MKKLYFLIIALPVLLLSGSCGTSEKASITDVNYNNQITGKGHRPAMENSDFTNEVEIHSATETVVLEENYAEVAAESIKVEAPVLNKTKSEAVKTDNIIQPLQKDANAAELVINKKEKKEIRKHIKKGIRNLIADNGNTQSFLKPNLNVLLLILAFFIPPLAVGLAVGITKDFWINLILTLLFFVPGVIHAIIIVIRNT